MDEDWVTTEEWYCPRETWTTGEAESGVGDGGGVADAAGDLDDVDVGEGGDEQRGAGLFARGVNAEFSFEVRSPGVDARVAGRGGEGYGVRPAGGDLKDVLERGGWGAFEGGGWGGAGDAELSVGVVAADEERGGGECVGSPGGDGGDLVGQGAGDAWLEREERASEK
ncbi:PE-PGRS family protein PE_PGRS33-like [Schistocerca gregaria]|uniref:PE-PGRS family protein PE_PGRS33-like n=1 Tax=Schistocerca gregaria TaxID=7010 RepID=UPI00211E70A1|nr:PE-PGRS family protein PE_PGRS33-like [Schistocerca gregaria]